MKKAILISIKPEWCQYISYGTKTIEVRKTHPKLKPPFKCYIYCSMKNTTDPMNYLETHFNGKAHKINGKVMGEFTCDRIEDFTTDYRANEEQNERIVRESLVPIGDLAEYEYNSPCLFGWHISDLKIYGMPKELSEFGKQRPPQSWYYVENKEQL